MINRVGGVDIMLAHLVATKSKETLNRPMLK